MYKKLILAVLSIYSTNFYSQLSANLESNSNYYIDDDKIKLSETDAQHRFRSNNYLTLNYKYKDFTVGAQLESYAPKALLNYSPAFEKTNLTTYYLNYYNENKGIDATIGHFYEQFGNGLSLRLWEDRQLGIANSLLGGRIKYTDKSEIFTIKAIAGKQRIGNKLSEGFITGADAEVNIAPIFKNEDLTSKIGVSYVNKFEDNLDNQIFPKNVGVFSTRLKLEYSKFLMDFEYLYKSENVIKSITAIDQKNIFDGNAFYLNLNYAGDHYGINANLRRLENFNFHSQRNQIGNIYNNAVLNYIPALTKQFDYSLANIYVYQAQPQLTFNPQKKSGEIGSQIEFFYKFKKKTPLGGKFGTDLTMNISNWYGLKGMYRNYINNENYYKTELFSLGEKYYSDQSIDIRTRFKENLKTGFTFINQYYNTNRIEETSGEVRAQTIVIDNIYKFPKSSFKLELQHQWADKYHKNWAAALAEYNFKKNWSIFFNDLYNYGNADENKRLHYYSTGLVFRKNSTRIQTAYGRQRGGLLCVGGVCRYVPESAGFSMNITSSF